MSTRLQPSSREDDHYSSRNDPEHDHDHNSDLTSSNHHDSSSLQFSDSLDAAHLHSASGRSLDERELRRHLSNVDSDFMAEDDFADSHTGLNDDPGDQATGADDTYLNFSSHSDAPPLRSILGLPPRSASSSRSRLSSRQAGESSMSREEHNRSETPPPLLDMSQQDSGSLRQSLVSSPAAAAAGRSQTRISRPSNLSYTSADPTTRSASSTQDTSSIRPEDLTLPESENIPDDSYTENTLRSERPALQSHNRPSLLPDRHSSKASVISATSPYSEADFSMVTGGALPSHTSHLSRAPLSISRMPSTASTARSTAASDFSLEGSDHGLPALLNINGYSPATASVPDSQLGPVQEEPSSTLSPPITPRANTSTFPGTTDTVIAQHVQNIKVPDTIAQEFRQRHPHITFSPEKRPTSSTTSSTLRPRPQSTLTLKEQNSKIDKLTKENFDLKLKIHFLDQALQNRSDEGVKDMINQNVQLQTDLLKERKDAQGMRRTIRELEGRVQDLERELAEARDSAATAQFSSKTEYESIISELREQIDHFQIRITKLSAEILASDAEKRKLADHIATMSERRQSTHEVAEDTAAVWKGMLSSEIGRREQAEADERQLREELLALRNEMRSSDRKNERRRSTRSPLESGLHDRNGALTSSSVTLIDQLRTENLELRRDLGAQTSMLTSRNKERGRLQQEVEDLKLLSRKADSRRSLSGDSAFERSASRNYQRQSLRTGISRFDELQQEEHERREGNLRDKNARLALDYQTLEDEYKLVESELNSAVEDLRNVQKERDDALTALEDRDLEFEKLEDMYKQLEEEAVLKIEGLEDNLDQAEQLRQQAKVQLEHKQEDFAALQAELKGLGTKHQRLEIQQESLQNEISFLREEQEGDKIKIGDLENSLQAAEQAILDEKDKVRELQDSLNHERKLHNRLKMQSKEEHQRILNDFANDSAQSKDDALQLRSLLSQKEREAKSTRDRLADLEAKLQDILNDPQGTPASFMQRIETQQSDLIKTFKLLEQAQAEIADKERLIKNRETMLENTSLESRHLSDLLDKERRARKRDLHQFEMSHRGNSTHLRVIAQHETKILELETAKTQDKRRATALEQQIREQLSDRNALLMMLWTRLSTLCGSDWTRSHNSVDIEAISQSLPPFKRNVLDAMKKIESLTADFKNQVRTIEKRLDKDYSRLEHDLEARSRRVEHLERAVTDIEAQSQKMQDENKDPRAATSRSPSTSIKLLRTTTDEYAKLKQENKQLKTELSLHRQYPSDTAKDKLAREAPGNRRASSNSFAGISSPKVFSRLLRHHGSSTSVETSSHAVTSNTDSTSGAAQEGGTGQSQPLTMTAHHEEIHSPPVGPGTGAGAGSGTGGGAGTLTSDERWAYRFKELEKRLIAEREARLLDRRGARQRLDARDAEVEELQGRLKRLGAVEGGGQGKIAEALNQQQQQQQQRAELDAQAQAQQVDQGQ